MKKLFPLSHKSTKDLLEETLLEYDKKIKTNPQTDKGHWVTINGNHVFIED